MDVFQGVLRPEQILTDTKDIVAYGTDWARHYEPDPAGVLLPDSVSQVVEIVRIAAEKKIALVPSGGRTGLAGGAAATNQEVVVSLEKLNKKIEISPIDRTVVCDAGCVTDVVKEKVAAEGLYLPVDFTSSGSSQIGGNVSTDVGGVHVIAYGHIRDWVLGLKVVTGDGTLLDLGGPLYKDRTGYDLRQLFIGAEGTLGIIVEVTLSLSTPPRDTMRALCGISSLQQVIESYQSVRGRFPSLRLCEYFPRNALELVLKHHEKQDPLQDAHPCYLLLEIELEAESVRESFEEHLCGLIEKEIVSDIVVAQSQKQANELLALRELISETTSAHYVSHRNDISVPISSIPEFSAELQELLERSHSDFPCITYGHIGDGNLHVNILKPEALDQNEFFARCKSADDELFSLVQKYRGSISAEHGIGLLKKEFIGYSRSVAEIEYMRAVRKVFDPNGIFNPGKVF